MFHEIVKTNQFDFERLDLSNCDFNHEAFNYLIEALKLTFSLKYLNLEGNQIGNLEEIQKSLLTFFSSLTKLKHLILTKCDLDDDSCWNLYLPILKSKSLWDIELNKNSISDVGVQYLSKAFK